MFELIKKAVSGLVQIGTSIITAVIGFFSKDKEATKTEEETTNEEMPKDNTGDIPEDTELEVNDSEKDLLQEVDDAEEENEAVPMDEFLEQETMEDSVDESTVEESHDLFNEAFEEFEDSEEDTSFEVEPGVPTEDDIQEEPEVKKVPEGTDTETQDTVAAYLEILEEVSWEELMSSCSKSISLCQVNPDLHPFNYFSSWETLSEVARGLNSGVSKLTPATLLCFIQLVNEKCIIPADINGISHFVLLCKLSKHISNGGVATPTKSGLKAFLDLRPIKWDGGKRLNALTAGKNAVKVQRKNDKDFKVVLSKTNRAFEEKLKTL